MMKVDARITNFAVDILALLHEREVIRAEQLILALVAEKSGVCLADGCSSAPAALGWIEESFNKNRARLAEIEGRKAVRAISAGRAAIKSLPPVARDAAFATARRLANLLRPPPAAPIQRAPRSPSKNYTFAVPFTGSFPKPALNENVGVVAHIFYPDLAQEMRRYLENIPGRVDLYLSTDSPSKRDLIEKAFAGWAAGRLDVRIAPNRGRDVAPKLITFRDVYDRHAIVLHLHSKKSPHQSDLKMWRRFIFENLMGDEQIVSSILGAFEHNRDLGMVAPHHFFPVKNSISWGQNLELARLLARRMSVQLDPTQPLDFPSGSMFWARSAALKPLLDLNLALDDFPPESGQADGTLAHAVERLYFHACEIAGLKWIKVCRPELAAEREGALVQVRDAASLAGRLQPNRNSTNRA